MNNKLLVRVLFLFLLSSNLVFAAESNISKEPDFLDKATALTNKAISSSKQIAKDVIDKTTALTNKAADSSKKVAKDVIDKATEVTNKVLEPKSKKNCNCDSNTATPAKNDN